MFNKNHNCLLSIIEAINKIQSYSNDFIDGDHLYEDNKSFDAVLMNFIVIGEMAEKLSEDFKEKNNHIDWFNIKGFRNIIAHNYFGIDAEEIWQITQNDIPKLKSQIKKITNT
jgi:uncharacterized protein with HEPN domain